MKSRATILLILTLTLLLGSCTGREAARTLDRIALLADTQPDSALSLLDSLAPHLGHSAALRARHTALSAHARHKADLPPLATAELEAAAAEFMRNPSPATTDHVLCFYHLGMAREADSIYAGSLVAYTRAEQAAKEIGDHHLLGLIYRHMADVYDVIYCSREAVHYDSLSLDEFRRGSPRSYVDYAMLDLAARCCSAGDYALSLAYADSVSRRGVESGDTYICVAAAEVEACAALSQRRYRDAIAAYNRMIQYDDTLEVRSARNLALALIMDGRIDEAKECLDRFVPSKPEYAYAYSDYNICIGDAAKGLEGVKHDVDLQNAAFRTINSQEITSSVREHYEAENAVLTQKTLLYRTLWLSISVIALLTVALVIYVYRTRLYRTKMQTTEAMAAAQELTIKLNDANRMLSETSQLLTERSCALRDATGSLRSMFQSRLASLEALCDALYQFSCNSRQQHKLRDKAMSQIMEFGQSPDSIRFIRTILDQTHDRVMEHFAADFPDVKEESYLLFTYMVLGLSSRAISVLTEVDITRVYKRKSALKKMILASDTSRRDHYLKFMA